jgi:hypothetical protein
VDVVEISFYDCSIDVNLIQEPTRQAWVEKQLHVMHHANCLAEISSFASMHSSPFGLALEAE